MNRLTIPRARRPVKARVSAVGASAANAARCTSLVPASGVSIRAEPTCAAEAVGAENADQPRVTWVAARRLVVEVWSLYPAFATAWIRLACFGAIWYSRARVKHNKDGQA
jgi:hypothetical protein